MQEKYLECGKIVNTHGVRGALKIESWCDSPEILCRLPRIYYKKKDELICLEVERASVHKNHVLMYCKGIDTVEAAILLKNRIVYADRDMLPVPEDRVLIADIIGLEVFDENSGEKYGVLTDYIENPGSDLFSVSTADGKEVLVPAVPEFIGHIDDDGIYLTPIPGMFDEE